MFCRFFIDRPIFATVLSLMITLAGGIALFTLPVTQYPDITPPTVEVSAMYAGANAKVVADTVAAPIEQQVNGVEGMMYMSSQCTNDGAYALTITFRPGTDLNIAQVLVQNRVALAQPILPELVRRRGVSIQKKSPSVLMIVNLYSPNGSRDSLYLSNYATIQLRDELSRLAGVGDISFLGQRDYSMRVWLDPEKSAARGVAAADIVQAIEQQNAQVAAGQIGQPPVPSGQVFQYTMATLGRLESEEQFDKIIVKTDEQGRTVRLRDVARAELGALGYDQTCLLDGQPSVALSIYQRPGSNALATAQLVKEKMAELRTRFPEDLDYAIVYDTTPFIQESVREVFHSLRDAVILVAIVVLIFLRGWRAALIPLVAVPVAVVGTFAAMALFGFSLNTLTLFGLVLAIGIVVDDAIVVVEVIEHHLEQGLDSRSAATKAMDEVAGPVIAVGLVLAAVFVPCAFITGVVGAFYLQFAVTIAVSTVISAFNSLTLSPALAVLLLRPHKGQDAEALPGLGIFAIAGWAGWAWLTPIVQRAIANWPEPQLVLIMPWLGVGSAIFVGVVAWLLSRPINWLLGRFFDGFNHVFGWLTEGYVRIVGGLLRVLVLTLAAYGGLLGLTWWSFEHAPTGFVPAQDKGYLIVNVRLPDSASLARTEQTMRQLEKAAVEIPGARHTVAISGRSILIGANASNFGSIYVMLDDFQRRLKPELSGLAIAEKLRSILREHEPEGLVDVVGAPPIDGLGTVGGFRLMIEDRGDNGLEVLQQNAENVIEVASDDPLLRGAFTSFRADAAWLEVELDRDAARRMGVSLAEIFEVLQVNFGSLYVNDFNRFGRTWQVNVQADAEFRMTPENLQRLYLRTHAGEMAPLGAFAKLRPVSGPVLVQRYNLYPSAAINVDAAPGISSTQAIDRMQSLAEPVMGPSMFAEWTELALLQRQVGNTPIYAFGLAVVLVFLVLAAQYESWSLPLAVILVVPMCLLCSIAGVVWAGLDVNIFTQIGFVVLVGLACKNAILIVEFARSRHESGQDIRSATLEACRRRLRPIVMTSLAFIIGVVPLMTGRGAGAEMRQSLGVAVFAGMLGVTFFGIFLTPLFFAAIQRVTDRLFIKHSSDATVDTDRR